ncbi:hypothetical protein FDECE_18410, partial [Fusarium decemcellulare]
MSSRPSIVGSDAGPEAPYPLHMEGSVISGFGRGSKEIFTTSQLGIPTANLPVDASLTPWISDMPSGVYFGYASLALPDTHPDSPSSSSTNDKPSNNEAALLASAPQSNPPFTIFPMVMSIGYKPFYKNTVRSAEIHVHHKFTADFYDVPMRLLILGFIREEKDYKSLDALIQDIN